MKVIGAGLPRTGTLSQKVALEMLGFAPCYHMVSVFADLPVARRWRAAMDGRDRAADILGDHPATVDWPGSYFTRELIEDFPDAKVLLSARDGAAWAKSMRATIWQVLYGEDLVGLMARARGKVDPLWEEYSDTMREMWNRSGLMPSADVSDGQMAAACEAYTEQVKAFVPAERLLVWGPKDGWEPLCTFLEVPVPEAPFPHVNDSESFGDMLVDGALDAIRSYRAAG
jgi:Sulfotransferase domain